MLCTAKKRGGGGGSARFHHSARCASKWRRPNLREAGRTTGNPMLCYAGERLGVAVCVFWGVRVASGAQWPTSVAAQVIWQAKQTKFSQKHQTSFFWPRIEHSVAVTYMIQSNFFACIRRFRDSRGGKPLTLERVVTCSDALCSVPFFASLFFFWRGRARLRCRFGNPLTWQGQQSQQLNSYRSGLRRPLSSSSDRCWKWLSKRLKFFSQSAARILPAPTSFFFFLPVYILQGFYIYMYIFLFESVLKMKCFCTILEKLHHFKVPTKVKLGGKCPKFYGF